MFKFILKFFLLVIIIIAVVGIYFYQFHTFEVMHQCISNTEIEELNLACSNDQQCLDEFLNSDEINLENFPDFAKTQMEDIFKKAIYCQQTCKMKKYTKQILVIQVKKEFLLNSKENKL